MVTIQKLKLKLNNKINLNCLEDHVIAQYESINRKI